MLQSNFSCCENFRKYDGSLFVHNSCTWWHRAGPRQGRGQCPGEALLVKGRNSKWSFTNEPEVRFRFDILVKVGPTISKMSRNFTSVKFSKLTVGGGHFSTRRGAALPYVGAMVSSIAKLPDDAFVSAATADLCFMVHLVCLFMKTHLQALL